MYDSLFDLFPWMSDMSWTAQAACSKSSAEIFFAPPNERGALTAYRVEEARSICNRCPVQRECLQEALDNYEAFGVWGGVNFENAVERTKALRAHGRIKAPRRRGKTKETE